jgi:hypothetical protein
MVIQDHQDQMGLMASKEKTEKKALKECKEPLESPGFKGQKEIPELLAQLVLKEFKE